MRDVRFECWRENVILGTPLHEVKWSFLRVRSNLLMDVNHA
jgi:hypothetical protein